MHQRPDTTNALIDTGQPTAFTCTKGLLGDEDPITAGFATK